MQALLFSELNTMALVDCPDPEPAADEVRMRVHAAGLCQTDLHILRGEFTGSFPRIPGHEYAGIVTDVGEQVQSLQVGDRICVNPNIVCGRCAYCRKGQIHLCENLQALGVLRDGGFAEFSIVPEQYAYKMPDNLSFQAGALVEPLACCARGIHRANIQLGDTVVILGAGAIGNLMVQLANISGAIRIIVSEPLRQRHRRAEDAGADVVIDPGTTDLRSEVMALTGIGADVVIDSTGNARAAELGLDLVRRGGTMEVFGVCDPAEQISISPHRMNTDELDLRGGCLNPFTHQTALDLLATGRVRSKPVVSDVLPLADALRAFELFGSPDVLKIQLTPNDNVV